jgi:hypothetical protein
VAVGVGFVRGGMSVEEQDFWHEAKGGLADVGCTGTGHPRPPFCRSRETVVSGSLGGWRGVGAAAVGVLWNVIFCGAPDRVLRYNAF